MTQRNRLHNFKQGVGLLLFLSFVLIAIFSLVGPLAHAQRADQVPSGAAAVSVDSDDIGGVVTSSNGPEAGVWVIAETRDLPVRYIKIVVTDDRGRYLLPELPKATYSVWVRGYGLVDSPKVMAEPGKHLNLTAVIASNEAAAAQYYPAVYWYSMLKIPSGDQFGSNNPVGGKNSGISAKMTQTEWLNEMKNNGCVGCHQLGQLSTRTIEPALGHFHTSEEAWIRRVQSGQAAQFMMGQLSGMGTLAIKNLADWTDEKADSLLPHAPQPTELVVDLETDSRR